MDEGISVSRGAWQVRLAWGMGARKLPTMTDPKAGVGAPAHQNPKVILACVQSTVTFYRAFYRVPWYG